MIAATTVSCRPAATARSHRERLAIRRGARGGKRERLSRRLHGLRDGVLDSAEECDDGNSDNGDSCRNDCTSS